MSFWNEVKSDAIVRTQSQPASGMANWKMAYVPAMAERRSLPMPGSATALTMETEKASIASPAPRRAELTKNIGFMAATARL